MPGTSPYGIKFFVLTCGVPHQRLIPQVIIVHIYPRYLPSRQPFLLIIHSLLAISQNCFMVTKT